MTTASYPWTSTDPVLGSLCLSVSTRNNWWLYLSSMYRVLTTASSLVMKVTSRLKDNKLSRTLHPIPGRSSCLVGVRIGIGASRLSLSQVPYTYRSIQLSPSNNTFNFLCGREPFNPIEPDDFFNILLSFNITFTFMIAALYNDTCLAVLY